MQVSMIVHPIWKTGDLGLLPTPAQTTGDVGLMPTLGQKIKIQIHFPC